jgi:hypothetical protein
MANQNKYIVNQTNKKLVSMLLSYSPLWEHERRMVLVKLYPLPRYCVCMQTFANKYVAGVCTFVITLRSTTAQMVILAGSK